MQKWPKKMGQELEGKPTYFVDKIWCRLLPMFGADELAKSRREYSQIFGKDWDGEKLIIYSKPHTIRANKSGRIKAGVELQPFVWSGKPYHSKPFYFSPKIHCVSTQVIQIKKSGEKWRMPWVTVDGVLLTAPEIQTLAINDGFKSTDDFFKWFDQDFTGTIIHWTDLKY
ncbi:hypothetical protein C7967_11519 [Thalassospira sp. 11-3]|nr:hypothetical protein C7967_11519 [Thalassospira sp. 11-3]